MDDTTKAVIDRVTINYDTPREITGGDSVTTFYDCRLLTPNDLARLAAEAVGHLGDGTFDLVLGMAYSGILFSAAVASNQQVAIFQKDNVISGPSVQGRRVLIVDDVIHTGHHMQAAAQAVQKAGGSVVGYCCVIDRSPGVFHPGDKPIWSAYQIG